MLEKLKQINNTKLELYNKDKEKQKIYQLIANLLEVDNLFLKIDMETAYAILRDLDFEEKELNQIYCQLIDPKL